jgi:hypothetical protein
MTMTQEYVFRGDHKPFAPDPKDERAREAARLEAEELVNKPPPSGAAILNDAELDEKVGEYQVGGLDTFGTESTAPNRTVGEERTQNRSRD